MPPTGSRAPAEVLLRRIRGLDMGHTSLANGAVEVIARWLSE
jgi:hypothetical protein